MPLDTTPEPIPNRLHGLVALITGAAGNIGLESARRYLVEGAKVVLVDISSQGLAQSKEELLKAIADLPDGKSLNGNDFILTVQADATSEGDVERYVTKTIRRFGKLDVALLCAGISYSSTSILDTDVEQYDKVMQVNCRSAFLGAKHCGRAMRDSGNGGSIILVSSIAGLRATPGLSAYSTSKFALRGLCITAAAELGQYNIRVNTVHPCGVNTPMFLAAWPEEKMKSMLATVPLGRWAEVADVAALVSFLGSADARFMTGGALKIDGGIVMF
ncbi:putative 2,5-dichloro-2,5-cyclohexadiene-1,4-diol dehydrogenase [Aspergillus piperis CBS 112811]|uniref:Putative 2,5-dichloro-2,5-cyclohexadiene-1,4-diol dehydrogenase n=1 Tax=Aspergillus piperis CBS 112811 TaxID=1448313 RepID=A0A8G1QZ41_9EURO|nr:putative 2,5-dichloro-2,5-cyclohexadiene-1,4-diol dehydrogenase [Aspergillus piperis CBS 112811]RAH56379.1 putative 2,5-dichloro-2,5-cyclohexadiene-1,4-diol dehydrogenase [Aspergillus piperis CBS 112811]